MTALIISFVAMVATIIGTIFAYLSYKSNSGTSTEVSLNSKNNYETNINSKNKYEYHEHNHYVEKKSTYINNNKSSSSSNSNDEIWGIIIIIAVALIITVFQFIIQKDLIMKIFYSITISTSVIWLLIVFIRFKNIPSIDKITLIAIKTSMFLPLIIIHLNLFAPSDYSKVEQIIIDSNGTGIISIFFDLLKTNDSVILFILFQVLGLILILVAIFLNYVNLFNIIKNDMKNEIVKRSRIIIYFVVFSILFSSGIIPRFITMIQNMTKTF